jgi:phage terminase large subunit
MTQNENWAKIQRHAKLRFLAEPHPYKILYGGRHGLKSWGIARQIILDAIVKPVRCLCCRETMLSIEDSVHQLLSDQIYLLGASAHFRIYKNRIEGINGSLFTYAGLRTDASHIKSYESYDRAWVEEAAQVSKHSWEILLPTIRKEGSEIWVSFNPELADDNTYQRWVVSPPPTAKVAKMSWRDADAVGWLPKKSKEEILLCQERDLNTFNHIYEGYPITTIEGAVYEKEFNELDQSYPKRITSVPYDRTQPVQTFWDIGDRYTAIWFAQEFPMEHRIIDYMEGEGLALYEYIEALQEKKYIYSAHYLPHDAQSPQLATGKSIEDQMRGAGLTVQIVPRLTMDAGISMVRTMWPNMWFDASRCADGLQKMRRYRWAAVGKDGQLKKTPLHDINSHTADAFRYLAVGLKKPERVSIKPRRKRYTTERTRWM